MTIKKSITERAVKELYQVMSTEHFARLSAVFWRLLNERQRARPPADGDLAAMEERMHRLEAMAERLHTKLTALEEMVSRRQGGQP